MTPGGSSTVHYQSLQYTTSHYTTVQYTTSQYSTLPVTTLHFTTVQYTTSQCSLKPRESHVIQGQSKIKSDHVSSKKFIDRHTQNTQNDTKQTVHGTTRNFWKSAGRALSLRGLPWRLPYNCGKARKKTSVRVDEECQLAR